MTSTTDPTAPATRRRRKSRRSVPDGDRTVTIRDVARTAGVSITTVSRVLSGSELVAADTLEKVQGAIAELNFVANAHARALTGSAQPIVACLVPEMVNASFAALAAAIEQEATAAGHLFMLSTSHRDEARERAIINLVCEQRARAVIIAGASHDEGPSYDARMREYAEALSRTGTRLVLCGRPKVDSENIGWVGYDDVGGARAATAHLIELGHERILVVGNNGSSTSCARIRGHRQAMLEAGLEVDEALAPEVPFSPAGGQDAVARALADGLRFTAVLGLADHIAVGALRALREAGLRVPEDVALAGFDDVPLVSDLTPPLTSVRVDFAAVGRAAGRIGLGLEPDTSGTLFPTELMVRASTA